MKRQIGFLIGTVLAVGLLWYLFLKPYDYLVTFKIKTLPGNIDQKVKSWTEALENVTLMASHKKNSPVQRFQFGDSTHIYEWEIKAFNDSVSQVKVYARDVHHSLQNKLSIPFYDTDFEKRTKATLTDFIENMSGHLKDFKVSVEGESIFEETFYAYVTVNSTQRTKARDMITNIGVLDNFLTGTDAIRDGFPFLEITSWNRENDSITYDFCYPIKKMDTLPLDANVKFKKITDQKTIKAIYNGNYITSDRAWYALLAYAEKNNLEVKENPIEVFYSNPNHGGNELEWKAEIFMPLKSSHE